MQDFPFHVHHKQGISLWHPYCFKVMENFCYLVLYSSIILCLQLLLLHYLIIINRICLFVTTGGDFEFHKIFIQLTKSTLIHPLICNCINYFDFRLDGYTSDTTAFADDDDDYTIPLHINTMQKNGTSTYSTLKSTYSNKNERPFMNVKRAHERYTQVRRFIWIISVWSVRIIENQTFQNCQYLVSHM